jgi:hypothetical protein
VKVFTIVGIVLLAFGIYFAYQAMQPSQGVFDFMHEGAPIIALTLIPMGVIFTAVGWYTTRAVGRHDQLIAQGLPGMATISSAAETGVYINERPMIKLTMTVQVPGRPPYTVEHREVIPLVALGMITPGSTLPVAVDPTNPQKLAIDWSGHTQTRLINQAGAGAAPGMATGSTAMPTMVSGPNALGGMNSSLRAPNTLSAVPTLVAAPGPSGPAPGMDPSSVYQLGHAGFMFTGGTPVQVGQAGPVMTTATGQADAYQQQVAGMRATSNPGRATIITAQDLGVAVQSDKIIQFMLNVTPESGASYVVQNAGIVPPMAIARALPGASVAVLIDRSNPQNVVIDWDRA